MTNLKPALIRFGLGDYLEEVPGWETRGSASFAPACSVGHHTAGPLSGDRPSLKVVLNGRGEDLPGPLANTFTSRSKVILVAAGRANHAGKGGFRGLVGNSAALGDEAESTGVLRKDGSADWTEFQRWAFPRVHAANLWMLRRDASWYCGHRDWTERKIDPTGIETAATRREITTLLNNPGGDWFDMATQADLLAVLRGEGISGAGDANLMLDRGYRQAMHDAVASVLRSEGVSGAGDPRHLADALVERLGGRLDSGDGETPAGTLTADDIREAVRSVFADASTP